MDTARLRLALPALGLAVTLAACGGAASPADVDEAHNDADIAFAQGMIPHHEQALEMSEQALDAAEDPEVRSLAEDIAAAQEPEIATMREMLDTWGAEQPSGSEAMDHEGMDHGGTDDGGTDDGAAAMPGMMSSEEMAALDDAEGAAFDRMWLTMMVEHHEGAVAMAESELADGENPQATALADEIARAQRDEIRRMQDLLAG